MVERKKNSIKNMPILTVLVPVYNTEKYIEKCLLSIANSELENLIEVIIVSDGSTDNSINIAKKIQKKYPKMFSIIEKENGGHGSTINVGIKNANGKYFRVLDSDDWFDKNEFSNFILKLSKCNSDLVVSNYSKEYVDDGLSEEIRFSQLQDSKEYNFKDFDLNLLNGDFFAMSTITYKTEILKKCKLELPEKTFYVDMIYDVFPILYVKTFTYFDCNVYKYYIGRAGQSVNTSSYARNHLNHNKVTHCLVDYYSENVSKFDSVKKMYIKNIISAVINTNYALYCLFFKKNREAFKRIKEFDSYLLDTAKDLYDKTGSKFIKIYRKTKFIFVLIIPNCLKMFLYKLNIKCKSKRRK